MMLSNIPESIWSKFKWVANLFLLIATILILDPVLAATSVWVVALYGIANAIWLIDCIRNKNQEFFWIATFLFVWDILLVFSRIFEWNVTLNIHAFFQ